MEHCRTGVRRYDSEIAKKFLRLPDKLGSGVAEQRNAAECVFIQRNDTEPIIRGQNSLDLLLQISEQIVGDSACEYGFLHTP